jgi:hypothetical protein
MIPDANVRLNGGGGSGRHLRRRLQVFVLPPIDVYVVRQVPEYLPGPIIAGRHQQVLVGRVRQRAASRLFAA